MTYIKIEKEKADKYYGLERKEWDLKSAIGETRTEPVYPLKDIAKTIKKILSPEELKSLIKELK